VDFNADVVENNVEVLKVLVNLPWVGFGEGTQGGDSEDSIWTNKADFDEKAQASIVAIAALEEAAESGDLKKFKAAFANTAKSCKTCHDSYRK
jgi:cytochrome c556